MTVTPKEYARQLVAEIHFSLPKAELTLISGTENKKTTVFPEKSVAIRIAKMTIDRILEFIEKHKHFNEYDYYKEAMEELDNL